MPPHVDSRKSFWHQFLRKLEAYSFGNTKAINRVTCQDELGTETLLEPVERTTKPDGINIEAEDFCGAGRREAFPIDSVAEAPVGRMCVEVLAGLGNARAVCSCLK